MKVKKMILVLYFFVLITPHFLYGQEDLSFLKKRFEEDRSAVEALILYPKESRDAMLEISVYPDALIRLNGLQQESGETFRKLMSPYSKEEQEKFWDLLRYKGLLDKLTRGNRKSEKEIKEILKDYPEAIHETALHLGHDQHEVLVKINQQEKSFLQSFNMLTESYPVKTKEALNQLVNLPEVLSIMQDNISLVVLLGDAYKKYPELIKQKTDSISLEAARQNAEDIEAWSKTLEENPGATEELKQSAKDYAKEYGYDERDYSNPQKTEIVEVRHYYDPYPYWCGWPSWYPDYWWYPYPYWYHWGFYFSDGGIIVIGLPSYFFVSWYFHYPIHHYYYPRLSNAYIHTYRHTGGSLRNSIDQAVEEWKDQNSDRMPPGLLNDDPQRPERLKEYGKFEEDYARNNLENPNKTLNRNEFFEKNEKKYPNLSYPKNEIPKIQKDYPDDIYERRQYPTKKEIENKTYDGQWVYPEKKDYPERKYYPERQLQPERKIEPERKTYPQNNVTPQRKYYPEKQVTPQREVVPQRQIEPPKQITPERKAPPPQRVQPK